MLSVVNINTHANCNKGGGRKLREMMDIFTAFKVVMVSWVYTYLKLIEMYTLIMYSLF